MKIEGIELEKYIKGMESDHMVLVHRVIKLEEKMEKLWNKYLHKMELRK